MSTTTVSALSPTIATDNHALVKTASNEYTADSVDANPSLATGLIKLKDGNYAQPIIAAADRYTELATDLTSLKRGG